MAFPLVEILLGPGDGKRYPELYTPSRIFRPTLTTCFAKVISWRSVELGGTSLAHIGGVTEAAPWFSLVDEVGSGRCAVAAEIANDLETYRFRISTSLPALGSEGPALSALLLRVGLADGGDITAWRFLMKVAASCITIGFARAVTRAVLAFRVASVLAGGLFAAVSGEDFVREATWMASVGFLTAAFDAVLNVVAVRSVAESSTDALPDPGFVVCRILVVPKGLTDEVVAVSASFRVLEVALALAVVALVGRAAAVRVAATVRLRGAASPLAIVFVALMLRNMSLSASRISCLICDDVDKNRTIALEAIEDESTRFKHSVHAGASNFRPPGPRYISPEFDRPKCGFQ